jgi:hypothetical protein
MTCNSNCYLPIPPRAWSRVQNSCSLFDENTYSGSALVPLPYSGKLVPASTLYLEYAMLNKGNVLQYKKNSSNLTKQQRYAQIAKGKWTNRNTTWATQSTRGYTNPNNQSLQRVNSINITLDGQPTLAPVTCPKPFIPVNQPLPGTSSSGGNPEVLPPPPPPTTNTSTELPPIIIEALILPIVIQDLGNLVCGTQENICTGELIRQRTDIICHPTSDSDVPGPIMELCWNDGNPTWYPRQRYVMTNSGNKWPVNATLVSAISIPPPIIVSSNVINNNEITLTWTQDERCIPATEFTIYEDGIPVKIVSGTTFTTTILLASGNGEYIFYIISSNSTIISEPSNSVTAIINNGCSYKVYGNYSVTYNYNTGTYTITFMYNHMNTNSIQLGCTVNNISVTIVGGGGGGGKGKPTNESGSSGGGGGVGGGGGGGGGIYINNISLGPDTYNIVVGNLGLGSNTTDFGKNGGNSYIQNSSSTILYNATGGSGGASAQPQQASASLGGSGGIGGGTGGSGGTGGASGTGSNSGKNGLNGLVSYSGGGGGGWGGNYETPPLTGIGQGGQNNIGGYGGYGGSNDSVGNGVGYGTGGGGGPNINNGGNGNYGVIIFSIQT